MSWLNNFLCSFWSENVNFVGKKWQILLDKTDESLQTQSKAILWKSLENLKLNSKGNFLIFPNRIWLSPITPVAFHDYQPGPFITLASPASVRDCLTSNSDANAMVLFKTFTESCVQLFS